ncbi:MAG: acyl-CoA dehydrogenase family protein [Nocardioides sp.]|nr:acyl-CoA dehydrogenase family protein [Nocardioides sp.]
MPIGISEDQRELAAALADWAGGAATLEQVRKAETDRGAGFADAWGGLTDLGVPTIAVAEGLGGGGGTVLDLACALEACAAALVPGPLLSTATAVTALATAGEQARPFVDAVCAGTATVALAVGAPTLTLDGTRVSGTVPLVADAGHTTHLLVPLAGEGTEEAWALVALDGPGVQVSTAEGPDFSRAVGTVALDGVELGAGDRYSLPAGVVARLHRTLAASEAAGLARWCLDTAVAYAKVREQFGKPIGAFQAIKHLCAQMLETTESATALAWDAAVAADDADADQHALAAAVAASTALDAAVDNAKDCIQVLGGIGFTFEHDAHLYLRRALATRSLLGGSAPAARDAARRALAGVRRHVAVELDGQAEQVRSGVREQVAGLAGLDADAQRSALVETGLMMPHWPTPYGRGAGPVEQLVIDEELAAVGVERPEIGIGAWAVPTILEHGTDAQRERFVRPTLEGEVVWCQLFSEPGAGSDLAGLRTRAVRDGDEWVLSGQKVWTSLAHRADWAICLARTNPDAPQHKGITYFLVDMRSTGIDVRPLREITGEEMFNEVFLDGVRVPADCVVGEVDGGWRLARTTLANERVAMAGSALGTSVERAITFLADAEGDDIDGDVLTGVGRAVAASSAVTMLGLRTTLRSLAGQGPGAESSVAKLVGVRSRQDSAELYVDLLGPEVLLGTDRAREALHELLLTRCLSIAGGTTQVLRNVAGERILGLPRG